MYTQLARTRYAASEHTQGPWDPESQHLGPVTALLVHEFGTRPGMELSKLSLDVFAPVPVGELEVRTELLRGGKRVQCLSAHVTSGGREYVRATAWRVRTADTPATAASGPLAPPPETLERDRDTWLSAGFGYGRAVDWRFSAGGPLKAGPATAWGRVTVPLVEGEEITPLERLALFADSGNGISFAVDHEAYLFVNVDLSISLFRAPSGEWIGMDSSTVIGPSGRGLTRSTLFDQDGEVGAAAQTLFVAPR